MQASATDLLAPASPSAPSTSPLHLRGGAERLTSQSQVGFLSTHGRQGGGGEFPSWSGVVFPLRSVRCIPELFYRNGGFCARASLAALISWPTTLTGGGDGGGRAELLPGGKIDKRAERRNRTHLTNRLYRLKSCSVCCPAELREGAEETHVW